MRVSRIARAALGAALVLTSAAAATPTALASASRAPAAQVPRAAAAGKPSPKPSPTPSSTPTPPPKPPPPLAPAPVAVMPNPTQACPANGQTHGDTKPPWAQEALGFSNVWSLTEGQGVTVAVVDSGVDFSRQLLGRVTAHDLTGTGLQDCASNGATAGHGTEVAAIIAASDMQSKGIPFEGVAPAAKILSVKVQSQDTQSGGSAILANGIEYAVRRGAKVINVSITTRNSPGLQAAVQFALRRNVVIVAAGGNDGTSTGAGPFYPASYPGVLSVGAVDSSGALAPFSDQRSHVAVTAPGVNVTSAAPGPGYAQEDLSGTSFAAAFVSGVAALVQARYPELNAGQVVARIVATADGSTGPGTGNGLVNPVEAVTAILGGTSAQSPSPSAAGPVSVSRTLPPDRTARPALEVTAGSLGAAVLVVLGVVVFRGGRRRRWQAGRVRVPAEGSAGPGGRPPQTPSSAGPGPGSSSWP
jgi:membrane-anchored mycosin MYCP